MSSSKSQLPVDHTAENAKVSSSVPPAMLNENKPSAVHNRSHAAHLETDKGEHTKPAGDLRFTAPFPTGRKQP